MIVAIQGQVVGMSDEKTKKEGKPYRAVQLLQQTEKGAALVRVNLWNGQKAELGKPASFTASVRAYEGNRGGAMLSVDVY